MGYQGENLHMQGELHGAHDVGGMPNGLSLIVCLRCRVGRGGSGETGWTFITWSQRLDWRHVLAAAVVVKGPIFWRNSAFTIVSYNAINWQRGKKKKCY